MSQLAQTTRSVRPIALIDGRTRCARLVGPPRRSRAAPVSRGPDTARAPPDDPLRGSAGPRPRQDRVRSWRTGHRWFRPPSGRRLEGGRGQSTGAPRGAPRRSSAQGARQAGTRQTRAIGSPVRRRPSPVASEAPVAPSPEPSALPDDVDQPPTDPAAVVDAERCPGRRRQAHPVGAERRRQLERPPARGLRLPALLGARPTARRRWTARSSRRSPTSASASTPAGNLHEDGTATGRRPSAGAAGRARR